MRSLGLGLGLGRGRLPIVGGGGGGASYLFHDTFTDTDGTALSAHTPEEGTWDVVVRTWEIWNNRLQYISGTNPYALSDLGQTDMHLRALVRFTTEGFTMMHILGRSDGAGRTSSWAAALRGDGRLFLLNGTTVVTSIDVTGGTAFALDTDYILELILDGDSITARYNEDDSHVIERTSSDFGSNTYAGVYTPADNVRYSEIEVTAP